MKNHKYIKIRVLAALNSTMTDYHIRQKFIDESAGKARVFKTIVHSNGMTAFYNRSKKMNGFPSQLQDWTINISYEQYKKLFLESL